PGGGKTMLAEAIIASNPNARILFLLPCKRLLQESKTRLGAAAGVDVYFCTPFILVNRLFPKNEAWTPEGMRNALSTGVLPEWRGFGYDFILADDWNNCTLDIFQLFITLLRAADSTAFPRFIVFGLRDYSTNGDARFLQLMPQLFAPLSPHSWKTFTLETSMRMSYPTARYINELYPAEEVQLVGSHEGPSPQVFSSTDVDLLNNLTDLIRQYYPSCVVLAPFLQNLPRSHPLRRLMNTLTEDGIPVAAPNSDHIPLNADSLQGKIVVTTYCSLQGSERDLSVVFMTEDWREWSPDAVLIALTRGSKQLVAVTCPAIQKIYETRLLAVSEIPRNVPGHALDALRNKYLLVNRLDPRLSDAKHIEPPDSICTDRDKQHFESVSDVNGLMVARALNF
ncbi:hypothetical protein DFH09DRAFT_1402582, partial [Mycena vulgaris]